MRVRGGSQRQHASRSAIRPFEFQMLPCERRWCVRSTQREPAILLCNGFRQPPLNDLSFEEAMTFTGRNPDFDAPKTSAAGIAASKRPSGSYFQQVVRRPPR